MPIRPINAKPKTQSVSGTSTSLASSPNLDWKLKKASDSSIGISMIPDIVREPTGSKSTDPGCLFSNLLNSPVSIAEPVANTSTNTVTAKNKVRIFVPPFFPKQCSGFRGSEVQGSMLTKLIELIGKRIKAKGNWYSYFGPPWRDCFDNIPPNHNAL
jgi:hypothetical protein